MNVRNVSEYSQKIKIKKPKSTCLTINCNKDINIAPGLDVKITIVLNNKENLEIVDRFIVFSDEVEF
jgi:hypothetical protein